MGQPIWLKLAQVTAEGGDTSCHAGKEGSAGGGIGHCASPKMSGRSFSRGMPVTCATLGMSVTPIRRVPSSQRSTVARVTPIILPRAAQLRLCVSLYVLRSFMPRSIPCGKLAVNWYCYRVGQRIPPLPVLCRLTHEQAH
jgi:hypothetical protein